MSLDITRQSARRGLDWRHLFVAALLLVTSTEAGLDQAVSIYLKDPRYQLTVGTNGKPIKVKAASFRGIVYANGATMHTFPDSAGRFVFDDLEPGKYVLMFDTPRGYRGVSAVTGSGVTTMKGVQVVSITLQAGAIGGSADLEITGKKGRIVGRVTQAPPVKN